MLNKKLFRDIKFNKSQFITIFLMVFIGVLAYTGIESYMGGMTKTADKFYGDYNLQELDATSRNFSKEDLENIKSIEHVNNAERKLTIVGTMIHEEDRTLQLNFIESNEISKFYVAEGESFDVNKSGVWLDEYYANKNNIKVGDTIKIKYDTVTFEEKVNALINVPDHVYDVKDEASIFPNHIDYGFAYLSVKDFPESYAKKIAMDDSSRFFKKHSIYSKYSCHHPTVSFQVKDKKIGLFPVYFVSIMDKDKEHIHYAVINGQTGKVAADMPIDFFKYIIFSVVLAVPIFFLLNSMPVFLPVHINIFTIIMSIVAFIIYIIELDKLNKKDNHFNDKGFSKQEINKKKSKKNMKFSYVIKFLISILLSFFVIITSPVEDYYYYGSSIIGLIFILWFFKDLITTYNLTVSRPIPQLDKRGGDEIV